MSFGSSGLRQITQGGLTDGLAVWLYRSTEASSDASVTGYFTGCGAGSRGSNPYGVRVGDVFLVAESTGGGTPGRTTMHSVISSTANQASTSASTGYNAGYDVSISSS